MNLFTPDDFKNKDGEYASPEAAAKIANEKLKNYLFKQELWPANRKDYSQERPKSEKWSSENENR